MKFGKSIQKKQLEIPEYAASFVNYKALKKLIKELQNSPVTRPGFLIDDVAPQHPQSTLQANKGSFFFRLDRELDKVNAFYTVKESESRVRLRVLIDKQRSMRMRHPVISRNSSQYVTLEQGFRDFIRDLSKLQQFIEVNATAFSKILKKWDKTSKSQTKEQYLSRAVEVQPVFNRNVIGELSDQATTSLLDCAAWAEGEGTRYSADAPVDDGRTIQHLEQVEADSDLLENLYCGDVLSLKDLLDHFSSSPTTAERITKAFLTAVSQAPDAGLDVLVATGLVDFRYQDEIDGRNCLHKAAMTGRRKFLQAALAGGVEPTSVDAYGRIPLHYASMNGHVQLIEDLVHADRSTVNVPDLDNFTPLIHAIVNGRLRSVQVMINFDAHVNQINETGHIPLNLACQHGSLDIVDLLLQKQPRIVPDAEGLYPQHLVARFGRDTRLLLRLQEDGANLDQADKLYSWTPLFHAASEGRVGCIRTLLACGVDACAKDEKGQSALYYATWEGHLECMSLLSNTVKRLVDDTPLASHQSSSAAAQTSVSSGGSIEQIPDLSLPPPILPTRRYGHSYLENKSTVLVLFGEQGTNAVTFYDESKYPAARLTVTPRCTHTLPRNLLLPIQDENRCISFDIDTIDDFALDFDVFPTFGKKVIAKGSVPSDVFTRPQSSSGHHYLSLLDPRLRAVGQMSFKFQIIKPFQSLPLDITPFATYWKATSQLENRPTSFVTGSSLSGEYIRVAVQSTKDGVPIVWPNWTLVHAGLTVSVPHLTKSEFQALRSCRTSGAPLDNVAHSKSSHTLHETLSKSHLTLDHVLSTLPTDINLELHVMYPTEDQERALHFGPMISVNDFADGILGIVFHHTKKSWNDTTTQSRSIVLSSYNADVCTALNWKQPNYPVLLCNDLATPVYAQRIMGNESSSEPLYEHRFLSHSISIKEAVRIAASNNFMGIICQANLLQSVPALVEAIKEAGLVLVSDASSELRHVQDTPLQQFGLSTSDHNSINAFDGIDGVVTNNGILYFQKTTNV